MSNEGTTRRRRGGIRTAALLASLCLAVGGQALVPSLAAAEPSMGDNCAEAIVPIDCFVDDDNGGGITSGSDSTGGSDPGSGVGTDPGGSDGAAGGYDPSGYQDPSSGAGLSTDGGGPWGEDGGDTADDGDTGDDPADDGDTDGDSGGDPPDTDGSGTDADPPPIEEPPPPPSHNHTWPTRCDVFFKAFIDAKEEEEEKAALKVFLECVKEPGDTIVGRADPRLRKPSARQRKAARDVKKRHVGHRRPGQLRG